MTNLELGDSEMPVLEETYRELRLPLLRLGFLLTGSRETAEDVVQSAFASGTATFTVDYMIGGKVVIPPSGDSADHVVPSE